MLNIVTTISAGLYRECALHIGMFAAASMNPWWFHAQYDCYLPKGIRPDVLRMQITPLLVGGKEIA